MSAGDVRDQLAATIQAALMAHNGIVNGAGNVYMGAARDIDPHVFAGILLSLPWIAIVELPETHVDEVGNRTGPFPSLTSACQPHCASTTHESRAPG